MTTPVEMRRRDRLADVMAEGCSSLTDAAYRLRAPIGEVEKTWRAICRALGWQAR